VNVKVNVNESWVAGPDRGWFGRWNGRSFRFGGFDRAMGTIAPTGFQAMKKTNPLSAGKGG